MTQKRRLFSALPNIHWRRAAGYASSLSLPRRANVNTGTQQSGWTPSCFLRSLQRSGMISTVVSELVIDRVESAGHWSDEAL